MEGVATVTLREIADRYGAQKKAAMPSIYEEYIGGWRDRPVSVLELGVKRGASLQMWRDYFPHGNIAGLDVRPTKRQLGERITTYAGPQDNQTILNTIAAAHGPFDIIVDDASHQAKPTWRSLTRLWPHLKPGGLYFIEDYHTTWLDAWPKENRKTMTSVLFKASKSLEPKKADLLGLVALDIRWRLAVLRKGLGP